MAKTMTLAALGSAATMSLAVSTQGSVLTNPTLSQGPNAIDPVSNNDEEIDTRVGTVSEAALEANPNFYVNQDFTGFESIRTGGSNIINFTGANENKFYDVRFDVNYNAGRGSTVSVRKNLGADAVNAGAATSGTSSVALGRDAGSGPINYNMVLDFGNYDSGSDSFTVLGSGEGVDAASLNIGHIESFDGFDVTFRDAAGNTLSAQSIGSANSHNETDTNPGDVNGLDGFYSYLDVGAGKVASILVTEHARQNHIEALDDLGFTAIPEPSSLALIGFGGLTLLRRKRRRG